MSDIIQLLPDHVANQIAAGEVVQRPSSVVKELLENSIDAGATSIVLSIKDAGKTLVQVIDNGKGMSQKDAKLCFERHATSKISKAEDLFNLQTKGFRGEALASIVAIAHVDIKTKPENTDLGTELKVEGGKIVFQGEVSTSKGTSIAVKNLFYNIPARRNFLKSDTVEMRHITDEFQRVALAHPNISFSLYHNGKGVYDLKINNLRKRIVSIFGSKTNEKLVPIKEQTDIVSIEGFITKHNFAKKKRGEQFFFVNNRFIKSGYLNHAVINAFEGLLENGYYPSYFLCLRVPPASIDINIHPTKTEIKFDNERALYSILISTIKHSLGQYNVAPVLDFNRDKTLDTPYNFKDKPITSAPRISVNPDFNPFKEQTASREKEHSSNSSPKRYSQNYKNDPGSWQALYATTDPEQTEKQEVLFEATPEDQTGKTMQIQKKYLLSTIKSGVVLIDQTAAHQRILYEKFLTNLTIEKVHSQQLLFPVKVELSPSEIKIIEQIRADLEGVGFVFSQFSKEFINVSGIPTSITESKIKLILEQLIADVKMDLPESGFSHFDSMAKSFAKALSIKTGTALIEQEQNELVNQLFSCKEPSVSPFGKMVFKTLTLNEIDNIFKR